MEITFERFTLSQLMAYGQKRIDDDDRIIYGDPQKLAVFAANPFIKRNDPITRNVLRVDGEVAGGEYCYPEEVVADNKIIETVSGSETFVKEKYRKRAVGLEFLSALGDITESDCITMGCGIAQRYARIHRMFGYKIFPMYRHIALFRSRSVVEMLIRGAVGRCLALLVNIPLNLCWSAVFALNRTSGCNCRVVDPKDTDSLTKVANMIKSDTHRFSEHHDMPWLIWHTICALHPEGPAKLYLVEKNSIPIAFFMLKRKFYEQASSRGFKNVMLGSVIEWGLVPGAQLTEMQLLLCAVQQLRKIHVDAAEVVTADKNLSAKLKCRMLMQVGESNFGIRVGAKSKLAAVEGWGKAVNWRLRPAMCDNGL